MFGVYSRFNVETGEAGVGGRREASGQVGGRAELGIPGNVELEEYGRGSPSNNSSQAHDDASAGRDGSQSPSGRGGGQLRSSGQDGGRAEVRKTILCPTLVNGILFQLI